ncbi:hypothetical protein [Anaeroselena agilis]|uniref:Uncharacterized protein n=1 Tax=Anaeroselena agilis TaxID=3063788 RepID=A0ABU3NYK3_9FIRM|nr:hypothetical protein [Selenomonadales bacterium 4137-cl]
MLADILRDQRQQANAKLLARVRAALLRTFLFGAVVYFSGHILAAHLLGRF